MPSFDPGVASFDSGVAILQRRLGLELTVLSNIEFSPTQGKTIDRLGDALQNDHAHGARHNAVLRKWTSLLKSAFGAAVVRQEPKASAVYSPGKIPDGVVFRNAAAMGGVKNKHLILEAKLVSPISTSNLGTADLGGRAALGNTESQLNTDSLGTPARGNAPAKRGEYSAAMDLSHAVVMLIMETFGGFCAEARKLIDVCATKHGKRHGVESEIATWATRNYRSMYVQRISVALHTACANEILETVACDIKSATQSGA